MLSSPRPAATRGVGLVELLVALLVASVGLLTFAALQAASIRYTQLTQRRAVANLLAQDFMERMRANTLAPADLFHYEFTLPFARQANQTVPSPSACNSPVAACDIADMAGADLMEVRLRVRELLPPDGSLFAQRLPAADDPDLRTLDLWIAWREPAWRDEDLAARPAGECPGGLGVANEPTVRCLRWRVRR